MRILHVIGTLNPAWGGPVEGIRNITAQAIGQGHDVHIVTLDRPDAEGLSKWTPRVHAIGKSRSLKNKYRFTLKLDSWLRSNLQGFDRVVVHSIWMYFSYAVWKAATRANIPYYLFVHGALDPWFKKHYPFKDLKKQLYWKIFEHKVVRDAQAVLFTTQEEMLLAQNAYLPYKCNPVVIGYGIAAPPKNANFDKTGFLQEMTASHPLLANRKFVLFLSRLHEKKGLDLLLKAFAASRHLLPETALVIAGPGDTRYTSYLQRLTCSLDLSDHVIWTGPLYGEAKLDTMRAAEVYALPSHQENFGIGVVEALACGTPVLISNKVNIWREVKTAGAGFVESDDEEGTAQLLRQWADISPERRSRMQDQAKLCFSEHFDMSVACERLFAVVLADLPVMQAHDLTTGTAAF